MVSQYFKGGIYICKPIIAFTFHGDKCRRNGSELHRNVFYRRDGLNIEPNAAQPEVKGSFQRLYVIRFIAFHSFNPPLQ